VTLVDSPWTRSDLRRSCAWAAVGLIALAICTVGVAHTKTYDNELTWTALGAVSLAVGVLGGVRWVLRGMRTVRRERRAVMRSLSGVRLDEPARETTDAAVYFTAAMSRYHLGSCPFARGKDLTAAALAEVGDRRPCEVCSP
jgi:hypothetical protein